MLEVNNLKVVFNENTNFEKTALNDVSFKLEPGDFVTVIGSNGAGKSTLFNALSGSVEVSSGTIYNNKQNITYLKDYKRSKFIGRLYQDPFQGTAPNMTIAENLGLAFARGKKKALSIAINGKDKAYFKKILKALDLGLEDRLNSPVKLLSGGQRQALTLLMATLVTPNLLLLDEHTAALDPKTTLQILALTQKIVTENKITTMMVTHNIEDALKYGNKTFVMNSGQIVLQLDQKQKQKLEVADVLKLYSTLDIEVSDVNVLPMANKKS